MNKKNAFHGSDLEKIEQIYKIKKEDIISYAANVNPLGVSPKLLNYLQNHLDVITSYPDRNYNALRNSIANYTGANFSHILVGNGATEIIGFMAQFINPKKALIIAPTYSEYAREIGLSGGQVDYFVLKEEANFNLNLKELDIQLKKKYDMLILCNPNNPTSSVLDQSQLTKILKSCKKYGTFAMIDETYVEFAPNYEKTTAIPLVEDFHNFIVLRGTSKFYAVPGLRLGYAITSNESLIRLINEKRDPWTINAIANEAGIHMFDDEDYISSTKTLIHDEQVRMFQLFDQCSTFKVYKPSANFLLLKILDPNLTSSIYFERAIKKGFMIRDCSDFVGLDQQFIRFCFMDPKDNDNLAALLQS